MSMGTHVIGLRSSDDPHYQKMLAIKRACEAAAIGYPKEVHDYFDGTTDDEAPLEVELPTAKWTDEMRQGLVLQVKDIPAGVSTIRFYNSW